MSLEIPKIAVAFGSVTPPQSDVIELRIHLGCTKEVSSFECLLQNFDKKYTVTNPINVGDNCHFDIGRGSNVPLILTGRVEEVEPESTPVENYIRVRGRCWGEKIFRRVVTKTYENQKGEAIVRDLIDSYVGLSHTRTKSDLTSDASSGQKDVVVADASIFSVGDLVKIEDDNAWEYNEISAVDTGTNTLTMVNNLANTYTVTANGKVWIDLIEKTDTTYTLLEYTDTPVFDILKYIAESADKSGVIGFDFRVEWDGKFAFFPKNSKTSPISLSEKIEHSRYSKDIHRVRNKIRVYGAAEKPYPSDVDGRAWSDSLTEDLTKSDNYLQHDDGKWEPLHPTHETVSVETTTVHTGSKSVKIQSSSYDYYMGITFTFNSDKYVNGNHYPKLCFTLREDEHHNRKVTVGLTDKDGNDCWQHLDISEYNEWQSFALGVGKANQGSWTLGNSEFDWENIKEVRFDFHQNTSQYGVAYVDRMHFGGCRWEDTEEDTSSQSSYGLRELVEVDEELHSDHECELRAKALLDHSSQPAEFLTVRTTCLDYGTDRLLPGDKIHVTLPNENIDDDFRIISVEYRASARDQTLEITLELGKEKPLLADYLYGLRSATITVEKLMRTKAGLTGVAGAGGGGGGGGGGMVQHGNEWHDPDFSQVGHTHVEVDITDLDHDAQKIKGKTVDDTAIADDRILVYKSASDKLVYEDKPSGGGGNGAPTTATYVTKDDESASLPNSVQHVSIAEADKHTPKAHNHSGDTLKPAELQASAGGYGFLLEKTLSKNVLRPKYDGYGRLGTPSYRFDYVYTQTLGSDSNPTPDIHVANLHTHGTTTFSHRVNLYGSTNYLGSGNSLFIGDAASDAYVKPYSSGWSYIGISTQYFKQMHAEAFTTHSFKPIVNALEKLEKIDLLNKLSFPEECIVYPEEHDREAVRERLKEELKREPTPEEIQQELDKPENIGVDLVQLFSLLIDALKDLSSQVKPQE